MPNKIYKYNDLRRLYVGGASIAAYATDIKSLTLNPKDARGSDYKIKSVIPYFMVTNSASGDGIQEHLFNISIGAGQQVALFDITGTASTNVQMGLRHGQQIFPNVPLYLDNLAIYFSNPSAVVVDYGIFLLIELEYVVISRG